MEKSTEILNELKNICPALAKIEKVNVFSVPEGYFIGLEERIATSTILQLDKRMTFQKVPDGYFDSLSSRIISKIKNEEVSAEEEIKSISPALHYLKEENVFEIPEGYFDHLSSNILNRINNGKAKIISIHPGRKWLKYAVAAMVAGIITIFSLIFFNTQNHDSGTNNIASSGMPAYMKLAARYKTSEEINQGIASLSDDEIAKYLEKNTSILDVENLIKNTDTKELPTPDEYLIDDNALNNYLQRINAENVN